MFSKSKLTSIFSKRKSSEPNETTPEEKKEVDKDSEGKTTASTPDSVSQKSAAAEMTE